MRTDLVRVFIIVVISVLLSSCVTTTAEVQQQPAAPTMQEAATYTGPKARLSVGRIKCKAAKCTGAIGDGLRDMLISALFKTNKFVLLGGREELEEIREEIDLGQSGYVRQEQAPQAGGWESADIIILGSITAFEPKAEGIGGGLGGLVPGLLGGIRFSTNDAYISMDLKIVDVRTRRIINTTTVDGKASSFNIGGLGVGWGSAGVLGGALGVYKNTPMEKAIRVMIEKAVNYIAMQVPPEYFRYSPSGTVQPQPVPAGTQQPAGSPATIPTTAEGTTVAGGLKRAEIVFQPGDVILWKEDFSRCRVIPRTVTIKKGSAECVEYAGKKWLVSLKGELLFEKTIKGLDLSKDWTVEFKYFISQNSIWWQAVEVGIGGDKSPLRILMQKDGVGKWRDKKLPYLPSELSGAIHHVAIQKEADTVYIFFNGKRILSDAIDPVSLKHLNNKINFKLISDDIGSGRYTLITDIKITTYSE